MSRNLDGIFHPCVQSFGRIGIKDMYLYSVLHAWIIHSMYRNESRDATFRDITGRYFKGSFVSVFVSAKNPRYVAEFVKVLNNRWSLQVYNRMVQMDFDNDVKSEAMVLLFEGDHEERIVLRKLKAFRETYSWNPRGRTIIIADGSPAMYMSAVWRLSRAMDVTFWSLKTGDLYAWEPYKKDECDILQTIHRVSVNELFKPLNLNNLNGCPLAACTFSLPPFVLRMNDKTRMYDRGVESKIMGIIAEKINGKLRYVEIPKSEVPWVWQTKDGKVVGAIGMLHRHEVDVAFTGMAINRERFQYAEPLTSHAQDEITWVAPTPSKGNPIQGLFTIFSPAIWIMVYSMIILSAVVMYYQEGKLSYVKCFMDAFNASMNLPIVRNSRFPLMLLYFSAIHMGTAYQAMLLFSLVREISNKPIETLEEAVDAGLLVNIPPSFEIHTNTTDHHVWKKIFQPGRYRISLDMINHLKTIIYNKSTIALYPKYTAMYVLNRMYPDGNYGPKVLLLKKRLAVSPLAFFTPRGHPLKPVFDRIMHRILAGGFGEMWLKRYVKGDWSEDFKPEGTAKPLRVGNLKNILYVYVVLNTISVFVFIAEIFWKSYRSKKIRRR